MKKLYLFLRDGELFYGSSLDDATALEVVNSDANIQLALGLALGGFVQHEQLYDLPQGWTVEIEKICEKGSCAHSGQCYAEGLSFERCAAKDKCRLIPLKEQSSSIAAVGVAEYGDLGKEKICGENCGCSIPEQCANLIAREAGITKSGENYILSVERAYMKYEEAAKAKYPGWYDDFEEGLEMKGFLAGASFADKKAHNAAIENVLTLLGESWREGDIYKGIEKLKL